MDGHVVNLKVLCLLHGCRPSDLATAIGISRPLASQLLNGTRGLSLERGQQIADLLGEPLAKVCQAYNVNALPQFIISPPEPPHSEAGAIPKTNSVAVA